METGKSKREATRDTLIKAAKQVIARYGVARLTLDMVAQEAGVSKGGILYHFPTKNALIIAMMDADMEEWRVVMQNLRDNEAAAGELPEAGRYIRGFLAAVETKCGHERNECVAKEQWFAEPSEIHAGMIAAVAGDHALLSRLREAFTDFQHQVEHDGIDPVTATVVRLAADGLFFIEMLGLAPPEGALREQVLAKLRAMVTPEK